MTNLDALEALAKAATPGNLVIEKAPLDTGFDLMREGTNVAVASYLTERDAKYYAAASPTAVLALIERVRRAEAAWEAFAQNAENMQNQAPYQHQPGWKYACCEFARQARDPEFRAALPAAPRAAESDAAMGATK